MGGIGMSIYVGNNVYTQCQIDKAPRRAFERGHVLVETKDPDDPFIPRDDELSNLIEFIKESASRGKYVVMLGEVFTAVINLPLSYLILQ